MLPHQNITALQATFAGRAGSTRRREEGDSLSLLRPQRKRSLVAPVRESSRGVPNSGLAPAIKLNQNERPIEFAWERPPECRLSEKMAVEGRER
jgi:hypothetical protein